MLVEDVVDGRTVMQLDGREVVLRPASLGEIIPLRHKVLRPGLPRDTAIFAGDERVTTHHFAAVDEDGRVVGCATFHLNSWRNEPAWQLRGMATDDRVRGKGVGRALLDFAEAVITADLLPKAMWCNARVPASGFYQTMGWTVVSEPFDIPTAGPHYRMLKPSADDR